MPDNDDNELEPLDENEDLQPSGFDELLYALSKAILDKRTKGAIAKLIENYATEIPVAAKRWLLTMIWSYVFTLGWQKIITNETAGTLLGAVVGAIFYGRRSN
jgi:Domain of unknown function (DUF313)